MNQPMTAKEWVLCALSSGIVAVAAIFVLYVLLFFVIAGFG